ncbi:MAG: hypothetical protein IT434_15565 [Phycisphaerales bacterium]|nr:hypothetical protein [Phycisphaerales bacterium]
MATEHDKPGRSPSRRRTSAEWATLIGSVVVIALLVGVALYEHFGGDEPHGVRIAVDLALDQVDVRDDINYVPFSAVNTGSDPAQDVVIHVEIKKGEETVEESTLEIAFLPNGGSVEGELVTRLDLSLHTIEARVASFQTP